MFLFRYASGSVKRAPTSWRPRRADVVRLIKFPSLNVLLLISEAYLLPDGMFVCILAF